MKWLQKNIIELLIVVGIVIAIAIVICQPAIERNTFNKFRDPNQPKATY